MKHHIHIKTYKKPALLHDLLQSIEHYDYARRNVIITVGDDNPGESLNVLEEFKFVEAYLTGDTNGIWANNNRGIKFFLEHTDADTLTILDNDIQFTKAGMLEELHSASKADRQEHITGFAKGLDGVDGLQVVFPSIAESKFLKWHPGTHGIMFWQTRRLVESVGYQLKYEYFYGAEHAEFSHRCLAVQRQMTIGLYPVLKECPQFFKLNPNDVPVYDFDINKVMAINQRQMQERDAQTISGLNLKEHHHHLNNELVIKRGDSNPEEKIQKLLAKGRLS